MSLTVLQVLHIHAPQYDSDADLANTIILATQKTSESAFGVNYQEAIALRTAHILTLRDMNKNGVSSGLGGVVGAVTSKSEGNTSISFEGSGNNSGTTGNRSGDLKLTRYGLMLLGLIADNISTISVAGYEDVKNNLLGVEEE